MAPRRKRTTGKKGRNTRTKPKLPEGELDSSMTVEEKESRLSDYINDYQIQVDSKLQKMRKCVSTVKSLVANIYRSALIQLPKSVKQMTMGEFMSLGGTIDAAINAQVSESIIGFSKSIPMISTTSHDRMPLSNVLNTHYDLTASHVYEAEQSATTSSVKTAGKSERKRKIKITEETPVFKKPVVAAGTRTSRRLQAKTSAVSNKITPMPSVNAQSVFQMPFITPKFDPRLPCTTPAIMREPKAGERIVSMCGSPLTNPAGPIVDSALQVFIPLAGGKTMQFSVNDKSTVNCEFDVTSDNIALQNIKLLQKKLSLLLKPPKNMKL